jgi:hypothetical protein
MKFQVIFKTPDAVEYGLKYSGAPEDGMGNLDLQDEEVQTCISLTKKFIAYGETITIEFDTETQTATIKPVE